jgi:hypothetical protein
LRRLFAADRAMIGGKFESRFKRCDEWRVNGAAAPLFSAPRR